MSRGRRSIRLPHYDYSSAGAYFVTIATHKRKPLFGKTVNEHVELNALGRTAHQCWVEIPSHFPKIDLDIFVVRPDHVHGVLLINEDSTYGVGAQHAAPLRQDRLQVAPGSLGAVVRSFKASVTKHVRRAVQDSSLVVWQRNYYERVIRDERELEVTRFYVLHNAISH